MTARAQRKVLQIPGEGGPEGAPAPLSPELPVEHPTMYGEWPATARAMTVTAKSGAHPSKWWMAQGLGGTQVAVLEVVFSPAEGKPARRVYVYDGDGSGTEKFITGGGANRYGHMEIDIEGG